MEKLKQFLLENNVNNVEDKIDKFSKYMDGTLEWNNKVNITTITNTEDFEIKHYLDSLLCIESDEIRDANTIVDLGTGGGFPGIPLAIVFPDKQFTLIDSLNKKLKVIDLLAEEIGITNIKTVHGRAEELTRKEYREVFDVCVSRAVANLSTLSEYCLPFVKVGGTFISYKGPGGNEELLTADNAIRILGGKYNRTDRPKNLVGMEHQLIFIDKIKSTSKKYPRAGGKPQKTPIK